jgi:hypothetical protein
MQNCRQPYSIIEKLRQKIPKHPAEDIASWWRNGEVLLYCWKINFAQSGGEWCIAPVILRERLDKLKVTNLLKCHHNFEPYYPSELQTRPLK